MPKFDFSKKKVILLTQGLNTQLGMSKKSVPAGIRG